MGTVRDEIDEAARRRFEAAWRSGPPEIAPFLPPADHASYLGTLVELIFIDMELRWKRNQPGQKPKTLQDYLDDYPVLGDEAVFDELIAHELRLQRQSVAAGWKKIPQIPDCEIRRELGRGGMGVVFLARQVSLNRDVAVKTLRAVADAEPNALLRFLHEAESVAKLSHANIVSIHHIGRDAEVPYFLMEYVPGGTLADRLKQGPLPQQQAAELVETLARAAAYAHQRGIIHRDLKPANILLQDGDPCSPKITDFGLAKTLGLEAGLTQTGNLLGTPSYMAPEQAGGHSGVITISTDVYSLGAILYEALTGKPPFQAESVLGVLEAVRNREPVPPSKIVPAISRDLETICLQCLSKDASKRYATAELLAEDLRRFRMHQPIQARRIGWIGVGVRWCRRNPALAATVAASLLLIAGVVGIAIWNVLQERDKFRSERDRAEANLYRSLVTQAAAQLESRGPEWWWKATEALAQAAKLETPDRDPDQLRDLYVRCLGTYYYSLRIQNTFAGLRESASRVAVSQDGTRLAVVRGLTRLEILDATSGAVLHSTEIPCEKLGAIAFHPTTARLYALAEPGTLSAWDYDQGRVAAIWATAGSESLNDFALNASATKIVLGTGAGRLLSLPLDPAGYPSGVARLLLQHASPITAVALPGTDDQIAFCEKAPMAKLRVLNAWLRPVKEVLVVNAVPTLRYAVDSHYLHYIDPLGFGFGFAFAKPGYEHKEAFNHLHDNSVRRVFSLPRGFLTASADGTIKIWGREASRPLMLWTHSEFRHGPILDAEMLPGGRRLVVAYQDGTLRIWEIHIPEVARFFGGGIQSVCFKGGSGIAFDGTALFDLPNPPGFLLVPPIERSPSQIWANAASDDGELVASGDHDGVVIVRETKSLRAVASFKCRSLVWSLAFQPGSHLLAAGHADITVYDCDRKRELYDLPGHPGKLTISLVFHPKKPFLASSGYDKFVRIWNLERRAIHTESAELPAFGNSLAFDDSGESLAVGCQDGMVRLWNFRSVPAGKLPEPRVLAGHSTPVRAVAFSRGGLLASGAEQGIVLLRDPKLDYQKLVALQSCFGQIRSLQFRHDDRVLITGNYVSTAVAWDLPAMRKALRDVNLDWDDTTPPK